MKGIDSFIYSSSSVLPRRAGRLVSEPFEVLRSRLLLMLLAQSEPEEEELRLVLAP